MHSNEASSSDILYPKYITINNRPSSHVFIKFHQQKWSVADEVF